ncbi:hypothetical protein [Paenarthrobacter sp. NPDC090522]|uniref:hypothetical protein n=1 Tax=Paenarthrobacter sp. NPDC090522 TaxID=3364383 RepID=UPI0037F6EFA0
MTSKGTLLLLGSGLEEGSRVTAPALKSPKSKVGVQADASTTAHTGLPGSEAMESVEMIT